MHSVDDPSGSVGKSGMTDSLSGEKSLMRDRWKEEDQCLRGGFKV